MLNVQEVTEYGFTSLKLNVDAKFSNLRAHMSDNDKKHVRISVCREISVPMSDLGCKASSAFLGVRRADNISQPERHVGTWPRVLILKQKQQISSWLFCVWQSHAKLIIGWVAHLTVC